MTQSGQSHAVVFGGKVLEGEVLSPPADENEVHEALEVLEQGFLAMAAFARRARERAAAPGRTRRG